MRRKRDVVRMPVAAAAATRDNGGGSNGSSSDAAAGAEYRWPRRTSRSGSRLWRRPADDGSRDCRSGRRCRGPYDDDTTGYGTRRLLLGRCVGFRAAIARRRWSIWPDGGSGGGDGGHGSCACGVVEARRRYEAIVGQAAYTPPRGGHGPSTAMPVL